MLVSDAIKAAGYEGKVKIAMDCAATEFYGEQGRVNSLKPPPLLCAQVCRRAAGQQLGRGFASPYSLSSLAGWLTNWPTAPRCISPTH